MALGSESTLVDSPWVWHSGLATRAVLLQPSESPALSCWGSGLLLSPSVLPLSVFTLELPNTILFPEGLESAVARGLGALLNHPKQRGDIGIVPLHLLM